MIVVFDGWKTGVGQENQAVIGGVKVIYSRIGDKADSVIKRIISVEKRKWIVVTSDRDIAAYAWASDSIPLSSEDFLAVIEREGYRDFDQEKYNEDYGGSRIKGNPRRLSKKEKAILRALNKL